ncbi:unnamed protein product, partial [Mesorhabditis belari]|uniref:Protein orai n=1 Tax=Mesorhabditis belari TaxID=2138241 RepID=A0AAF3E9N9_9BILA
MPRSHSPSVSGMNPPLLKFDRLASTSCDDVQLTWHGFDRRNAITETRSVFEGWQPSRARAQHLLLPQTFLSSSDKNGQSHKYSQLSQAHRLKNHSSQSLFEKHEEMERHRGPLSLAEEYNYKLSRAQLKSSSNTSALIVGFAMVALVELHYDEQTPHSLLIILGVVTTLLVSVHLLALMMSTCILPYMEATGATQDSPHLQLSFFIKLSWLFSTCIGLILFLVEIGIICYIKFTNIDFPLAAYITTAMMIPVFIIFVLISYLIHKNRTSHSIERIRSKVAGLTTLLDPEKGLDYGVKDL